jgi:hypothetical protein
VSGTAFRGFFIISALAPGRLPGADYTNSTLPVGEGHEEQPILSRMTHQNLTLLGLRMIGIRMNLRERVLKHGDGLLEGHTVLLNVGCRFGGVPFEGWSIHLQALA